jgi:imidazole glycerol-phosphate synthase subunit HisF
LQNGADKISVNSAAFKNPELINLIAKEFGSQCVVLAIDTKKESDGNWYVYLNGGRLKTGMLAYDWAQQGIDLGAGEILLTSMNNDGTKNGFAEDITSLFSKTLPVPIIASGGAGTMEDFADVFINANADAALAASVFHFGEIKIPELKNFLSEENINVRI